MADEKLSGKAGLDTTDFKTGISTMSRELRVLESGFRASAASLGDWANDATGLESRIKSLNSQMDIQRQKVALTRAEYERIKQEKGENSRAAQDLEIKLNKEVETLGKMENELQNTEGALEEMQSTTEETGESVEELGESADESGGKMQTFQDVIGGMGAIAGAAIATVAALAAAVVGVGLAIGGLVFNAAGAAAELVDLSSKTGISTTRLQELSFVGDQVGTSLDTITGAQARLTRSMATAQEQNAKFNEELASGKQEDEINVGGLIIAFNKLGVAVEDSAGNLRDQEDVFADTIDALGKIENPAERDALAMEIFGKSAQELNPLIKAGSEELARLAQEAHDMGAVMDEDAVAGLEAFDDTMSAIQAGIKGTLGSLAGEFLPAFQEVGTALQDLFKSDEFKQALREFGELIKGVVTVAVDVLGKLFSGDFEGALAEIFGGDAAATIVRVFGIIDDFIQRTLIPFVTTHAEEIKAALIGIAAALGAAGLVSVIAAVIAAINPVTLIIAAIVAAVGLLSAAWAGNWGGIRDTVTQIWEGFLKPTLETLWEWLSTNIPAALQTLSAFWTGTLLPAIQAVWGFLQNDLFPLLQALAAFMNAVFSLALRVLAGIFQNVLLPPIRDLWNFLQASLMPIFRTMVAFIQEKVQPVLKNIADFVTGKLVPAFRGISNAIQDVVGWLQSMANYLNNLELPAWLTPGSPTPWEIGLIGINEQIQQLNSQLPALAHNLDMQSSGTPGAGGGASVQNNQQIDNFQFFAPLILQGSTPAGSLGARLKGRRY